MWIGASLMLATTNLWLRPVAFQLLDPSVCEGLVSCNA
jgi:hypothetical protein